MDILSRPVCSDDTFTHHCAQPHAAAIVALFYTLFWKHILNRPYVVAHIAFATLQRSTLY